MTHPGVTGTGAGRPGRDGPELRVRATASGRRTGTAGQTGQSDGGGGLPVILEQILCLFFPNTIL